MSYQPNYNILLDDLDALESEGFDLESNFDDSDLSVESQDIFEFTESDFDQESPESIQQLADRINFELEGMSEAEAREYLQTTLSSEAFPLIPLITALAPVAIQAVSGLVNNAMNRRRPAPAPAPRPAPAPVPQNRSTHSHTPRPAPIYRPAYPQPSAPPPPPVSMGVPATSPLTSLLRLLQNPAVMNALSSIGGAVANVGAGGLQNIASAGLGAVTQLAQDPQIMNLLLQTVSQLATNARSELYGDQLEEYPQFLFDAEGNLQADPYAPEQMAELLMEKLNAYQ